MMNHLIAPCGMNCGICLGFLRDKNKCPGCRNMGKNKPGYCRKCIIKNCALLAKTDSNFCYECSKYPCTRLKQLDKRYRTNYNMSMIENFDNIQKLGLDEFLILEQKRWACTKCDGTICVHRGYCLNCGK
ncbi:DUF3795 domain-containing protein [Candidatus Neomarinimicrobiota bacterium]